MMRRQLARVRRREERGRSAMDSNTLGDRNPPRRSGLNVLLLACAATLVLSLIPGASLLLYPIRLFVTFVHESSHPLVAGLTGGQVLEIRIEPYASGDTLTAGGLGPLIVMAGYLGATASGAWLLAVGRTKGPERVAVTVVAMNAGRAPPLLLKPGHNPVGLLW